MSNYSKKDIKSLRRLFPGLGCFGGTDFGRRAISVGKEIDTIRLSINAPQREVLNIHLPILELSSGAHIRSVDYLDNYTFSTRRPDPGHVTIERDHFVDDFLSTDRQVLPSVTIRLKEPLDVANIILTNRNDRHSIRSKFLELRAYSSGAEVLFCALHSEERLVQAYLDLKKSLDIDDGMGFEEELKHVTALLKEKAEAGWINASYLQICELLPVYDPPIILSDYHKDLISCAILRLLDGRQNAPTAALGVISNILSGKRIIEKTISLLNEKKYHHKNTSFIERWRKPRPLQGAEIIMSKHTINFSDLSLNAKSYVKSAKAVIDALAAGGFDAVISYGTLLGAKRRNELIKYDDDLDVVYFDGSSSQEEMFANRKRIIAHLKGFGIELHHIGGQANFMVEAEGRGIDLFPSWSEGDDLHIMMERGAYRPIRKEIFFGEKTYISMYDVSLRCPTDPQSFLSERYGKNWRIEDKFHEWPWRLS